MTKFRILLSIICSIGFVMPVVAVADVFVFVNEDSKIQALTQYEVKDIYFSKVLTINNKPVNLIAYDLSDEKVRTAFYRRIANKNLRQVNSYWARMVYSGRGKPPETLDADEIIERVLDDPNAIGYVPSLDLIKQRPVSVIYHIKQ